MVNSDHAIGITPTPATCQHTHGCTATQKRLLTQVWAPTQHARHPQRFRQQEPPRATVKFEPEMWIAGVDEAGRGPIAGPVVAACVVLPDRCIPAGIADSKQLTPAQREQLDGAIKRTALAWAIGIASPREIERHNILHASLLAMRRAVLALTLTPQQVLIDGKHTIPNLSLPQRAIVDGDAKEACIAAASILAKVARDRIMTELDRLYPCYGFAQHKGYPTALHIERLSLYGACPAHRRTYAPVAQQLILSR